MPLVLVGGGIEVQETVKDRIDDHDDHYDHIYDVRSMQIPDHLISGLIEKMWNSVCDQSRDKEKDMMAQFPFYEVAVPFALLQFSAPSRNPSEYHLDHPVHP